MVLLNPGPVNVSERVRQALLRPDVCHRESEITELLHGIQAKLLRLFVPGAEAEYAAVVLTGSGTAAYSRTKEAVETRVDTWRRITGREVTTSQPGPLDFDSLQLVQTPT